VISVGYKVLPAIYDRWQATYGKDYSALIFPRLLGTFRKYSIPATQLLDVACGTGSLALLLQPYGWQVWVVDGSAGMVREARLKCRPYRHQIHVGQQDMRRLHVRTRVDVCTCMFDSMNHLTTLRDLNATFRGMRNSLNPGGWVIFDVNNDACYRTLWKGTQTLEHQDFVLRFTNSFDPVRRLARSHVGLRWKRRTLRQDQEETVVERCFTRTELRRALHANGFEVQAADDFNFAGIPEVGELKTWWVAKLFYRKPSYRSV
jgi:SAM-dependent methyltransferase